MACAILLVGCAVGTLPACFGAEKSSKPTLEDFLKRLRYDAVKFIPNDDNYPFVDGEIPPDRKLRLIVDTGCSLTTFDESRSKGLKSLGKARPGDELVETLTNLPLAMIEKFIIGHTMLMEQPVLMKDVAPAHGRWASDGILGADFFHRNYCLIDCGTRQLYVRTNEPSQQESEVLAQSLRLSGFAEVPITWELNAMVEARINELPVCLLVDTGAFASVIDDSEVKRLGLKTVRDDRPAIGSLMPGDLQGQARLGIRGDVVEFKVSRVKSLKIGERSWKSFPFAVQDLSALRVWRPGTKRPDVKGLLGRDILMGYGALIDFGNHKAWFPPEKKTQAKGVKPLFGSLLMGLHLLRHQAAFAVGPAGSPPPETGQASTLHTRLDSKIALGGGVGGRLPHGGQQAKAGAGRSAQVQASGDLLDRECGLLAQAHGYLHLAGVTPAA